MPPLRHLLILAVAVAAGAAILATEPDTPGPGEPPDASPIGESRAGLDVVLPPPAPPPVTPAAVPSGPAIPVDSRDTADTYPIWLWTISTGSAVGEIEESHVEDGVLTLSGWAGDTNLGLRMSDVLLVACDRVIASVPVDMPRTDIARQHPNLPAAGWSARLALSDLVPCTEPAVTAYSTALFGAAAFPLEGDVPPAEGAGALTADAVRLERPAGDFRTPRTAQAPVRDVEVGGSGVALRRCGKKNCEVVARLPAGRQRLLILDDQAGWYLVAQTSGAAGWAPESALHTAGNAD